MSLNAGPFYGTFIEHWPRELLDLSLDQHGIVLNGRDALVLEQQGGDEFSAELIQAIEDALRFFPDGAFLRLGGRSFVTPVRGPRRVRSLADALGILGSPGERAARMARRCRLACRPVWLFVRAWTDIAFDEEFRVFVEDGRVAAATQYHASFVSAGLHASSLQVTDAMRRFAALLLPVLHLPDVVADLHIPWRSSRGPRLIELNPALRTTGRGLFEAVAPHAFDGTLRYRMPNGSVGACPIASTASLAAPLSCSGSSAA